MADYNWQQDFNYQPDQSFTNPQQFQTDSLSNYKIPESQYGDSAPTPTHQDFSNTADGGPSWYDKLNFDTSTKTGMDNMFRLGQMGVGGLGAFLQMRQNAQAQKAQNDALSYLRSQGNPNAQLNMARLNDMINNPSGYLNDPVDNAQAQQATEGAMRMAARAGRPGMSRDDMLNIQKIKQGSYNQRLQNLQNLYQHNQQNANGISQLMSKPVPQNYNYVLGGLNSLMTGGRTIAASSGLANQDPRIDKYQEVVNNRYDLLG